MHPVYILASHYFKIYFTIIYHIQRTQGNKNYYVSIIINYTCSIFSLLNILLLYAQFQINFNLYTLYTVSILHLCTFCYISLIHTI